MWEKNKIFCSPSGRKMILENPTNIIIFNTLDSVDDNKFMEALKRKDVHISSMGNGKLRMVTHLDFTDDMLEIVIKELTRMVI